MKQYLLLISFFFLSLLMHRFQPCFAQTKSKGAEFEVRLAADGYSQLPEVDFLSGYRFNDHFRIGLGIGITESKFSIDHYSYRSEYYMRTPNKVNKHEAEETSETIEESLFILPVFLNMKYNILTSKFSPFVSMNVGFMNKLSSNENITPKIYAETLLGIDWKLERGLLFLAAGLSTKFIDFDYEFHSTADSEDYSYTNKFKPAFCIGYRF